MSQTTGTIKPFVAILICINSIIGAGLFINPRPLTEFAGAYGFLVYLLGMIILFPLVLSIAELARLHPVAGGLYVYSKTYLGRWAGFISAWAYFVGKTTSVATLMHKFVQFFQLRIPGLETLPTLAIDFSLILFFAILNIIGVAIGGRIQYVFSLLKATPLLFTFMLGAQFFDPVSFQEIIDLRGVITALPIAIFALLGFEVICAIGNQIVDAKNNIKRVILTSFLIVATINTLFQATIFGCVGHTLAWAPEPLLALATQTLEAHLWIGQFVNGVVFASILGGFFSLMTSNCWNLHTLANNGHFPGKKLLTKINQNNVPWASLLAEVLLACTILLITADQVPLQNMSVFSQIISFFMAITAACYAVINKHTTRLPLFVPVLALFSCFLILGISLHRIISSGISFAFVAVFAFGCIAAAAKYVTATTQE